MAESLLHHNLIASASKAAEKIAYRFGNTQLTYGELEQKTNQLARQLVHHGVKRGDRIGVYLDRSLETTITVYGIFKAGAAYVPIDPQSPVSRVAHILQSCDIGCLVSATQKREHILELIDSVPVLNAVIGCEAPEQTQASHSNRCQSISWPEVFSNDDSGYSVSGIKTDDLAYVMFTSGSTGIPKGIMHTHSSGNAYARITADLYSIRASDRIGNHAPLHFDISTLGYLTSPLVGATTIIIPEAHTRLPASMTKLVQDEQLTVWYSVPFALIQMLTHGALDQRDFSSLRLVLHAGEPFSPRQIRQLMDLWPGVSFANEYGPAETNVCTHYLIPGTLKGSEEAIPIGYAFPESTALILGEGHLEIKGQEVGELLINSPLTMQGYWQRPDLNAKCFYKNPADNKKYYRTGDLVSRDEQGIMHYHGRKDRLVKVRGNRIELDEIEAIVLTHDQVVEAAAYLMEQGSGHEHIELAITVKANAERDADQMTHYIAERLPRFAVPGKIVFMEQFPRTASGKIDRLVVQQTRAQELQNGKMPS
jgi:amino acid adenylation domain-containing protein